MLKPNTTLIEKTYKIRQDIVNLSTEHSDGHVASAFSCVEILVSLYYQVMNENDQFIMSKGHAAFALYSVLMDKGFKPCISGHPDCEPDQGICCTTGSLGHGVSIAAGKAFAKKIENESGRVFVLLGDGECQEGTIWETMNLVHRYQLNNLITIVDHNKLQAMDSVKNIMNETNLKAKFQAFGLDVNEVDGHDVEALSGQLSAISRKGKPTAIIAHTVKGKGISFMENDPKWQSRMLECEELKRALAELDYRH